MNIKLHCTNIITIFNICIFTASDYLLEIHTPTVTHVKIAWQVVQCLEHQ